MKLLSFVLALLQVSSVFAMIDIDPKFTTDEKDTMREALQDSLQEKLNAARTFQALRGDQLPPNTEDIIKRLLGSRSRGMTDAEMSRRITQFRHFAAAHWFSDVNWHQSSTKRVQYVRKLKENVDKRGRGTGKTTLTFSDPVTGETVEKTVNMPTRSELGLTFHSQRVPGHAIVWQDRDLLQNTDRDGYKKDYRSGPDIVSEGLRTFMMKDMFNGGTINRVLPHEIEHVPVGPDGRAVVQDSAYVNGVYQGSVRIYSLSDLLDRADQGDDLTRNAEFFNHVMRWTTLSQLGVTITENGNIPIEQYQRVRRASDAGKFMTAARQKYRNMRIPSALCSRDGSCGLIPASTDPEQEPASDDGQTAKPNTAPKPNPQKPTEETDPTSGETDANPDSTESTSTGETDANPDSTESTSTGETDANPGESTDGTGSTASGETDTNTGESDGTSDGDPTKPNTVNKPAPVHAPPKMVRFRA